jgi:hypothetical protein
MWTKTDTGYRHEHDETGEVTLIRRAPLRLSLSEGMRAIEGDTVVDRASWKTRAIAWDRGLVSVYSGGVRSVCRYRFMDWSEAAHLECVRMGWQSPWEEIVPGP